MTIGLNPDLLLITVVSVVQERAYPKSNEDIVILHSDGLQSQWNLSKYPGILRRSPSLIAAVIYRDFTRGRDDVTVVVVKS